MQMYIGKWKSTDIYVFQPYPPQESLVPEMMVYFPQTLPPEILRAGGVKGYEDGGPIW